MTLDEFRKQNPAYSDVSLWPDEKLASGLYSKYYSQKMSREDFDKQVLTSSAATVVDRAQEIQQSPTPTTSVATGTREAAKAMEARIKAEDKPVERDPWTDPTNAIVGPGVLGAKIGAGLAKTAAMVATSLLAEPVVGTAVDEADKKMTEKGVSPYVQLPVDLALSMAAGSLTESGIAKVGSKVKQALKGAPVTVESVAHALQNVKVENTGAEQVIQDVTKTKSKPLDMRTAVTEITKKNLEREAAQKAKDFPELVLPTTTTPDKIVPGAVPEAGTPGIVQVNNLLVDQKNSLTNKLETATPQSAEEIKKNLKTVTKKLEENGLDALNNLVKQHQDRIVELDSQGLALRVKMKDMGARGENTTTTEILLEKIRNEKDKVQKQLDDATQKLNKTIENAPTPDPIKLTRTAVRASAIGTSGAMGGVYNGVDWDTYEETGEIKIDPDKALRGMLAGIAVGTGIHMAPKAANLWTQTTKNKLIDPVMDTIKGSITNEALRYQLGLNRSKEVGDLVRNYQVQSKVVIDKAVEIGKTLNEIAPGALQQKRLTQILEGGVTTNPTLIAKARQINEMFADLKNSTRELNLSHYSSMEALTRQQRADLRNIIKDASTPDAERITAQKMLNNHYHIGSASEYLPIFNPAKEGLTRGDKKILTEEIQNLKHKSRYQNPEGRPEMEAQIAELEKTLKGGQRQSERTSSGLKLNQGYSIMRQDLPSEVTRVYNDIIGPAYRTAKGAAIQGTDVLKAKLFNHISENPEWTLSGLHDAPANYVKIKGDQWGSLDGKFVRNDVLSDLDSVIDLRSKAEVNMDKIMGYWKYGKAILNPATHARNFVSNMVLADMAGVSPADTAIYASAANALRQGANSQYYREAERAGLFAGTFRKSELLDLRNELNDIRSPSGLQKWFSKAASVPSAMYENSEKFFKTAVFIKARESGMSPGAAMEHAEKYLFNYSDIPPMVKHYKRWASPFVTFAYKATPLIAETAITKPWKLASAFGAMYGLEQMAQQKMGLRDETIEKDKSVMLSPKGQVLLPFKDDQGNRLYGNIGDFMPWSNMGRPWGQSGIPFADFLPSNPAFTLGAAIISNKDSFTGEEIYNQALDSVGAMTGKYLELVWKQTMPSIAPGGYSFEKIHTAIKNSFGADLKDYTGQTMSPSGLLIKALLGVKLTKANQELYDRFSTAQAKKLQKIVGERRTEILKQLQRNEITENEADKLMEQLRSVHMEKQPQL